MEEDMKNQLKELHIQINKLVINKWYFYNQPPWNFLLKKYNYRTELKNIKEIRFVKDV